MDQKGVFLLIIITCSVLCINARIFDYITIKIYRHDVPVTVLKADTINNEENVTEILIENEDIPILKSGSFQELLILKNIFLQRNNLESIEEYAFDDLPSLQVINLNFNNIKKLSRNIFANLTVWKIALKGNGMSELDTWSFYNLTQLSELDLSSNNLASLPSELFKMTRNLRILDLSWNHLKTHLGVPSLYPYPYFEEPFWNIQEEDYSLLDLSFNQINEIGTDIFQGLTGIKNLRLNYNNITNIKEAAFKRFLFLDSIELEGNDLENLGSSVLNSFRIVKDINLANNPWSTVFVCEYYYWCSMYGKFNTIEDTNCTLTN